MKTVLIATERDLEQNLLSQTLEGDGYAVLRSRDGLDALDMARSALPKLLLINVALPKLDGFALFRRCQQDEQLRQIPIVLFSTRSKDEKSSRFAHELGVNHFVGDALRATTLLPTVAQALSTHATLVLPMLTTGVGVVKPGMVFAREHTQGHPQQPASEQVIDKQESPATRPVNGVAIPDAAHTALLKSHTEALQALRDDAARQAALLSSLQSRLEDAQDLGQLFVASPIAMWLVDKSSQRIVAANQAMAQLFGYAPAELLQLDSQQLLRVENANAAQGGSTHVLAFRHKDGRGLSLLLNSVEVTFKGQATELLAAQDVSYRVRGERALADEVLRLKTLLAALPVAYCLCDDSGQIRDFNEAASRLLGKSREQLLQESLASLTGDAWPSLAALSAGQVRQLEVLVPAEPTPLRLSIVRGLTEVGTGLQLYLLTAEPPVVNVPVVAEPEISPPASPPKLPAMLEIMRYSEDADENTLLQYAVARIAHAFNSPVAILAALEGVTQTMEVLAMTHASQRSAGPGVHLPVPAPWQSLLSSRSAPALAAEEDLLIEGWPEISSYQLCVVTGAAREQWLLLTANRQSLYSAEDQLELQYCAEMLAMLLAHRRRLQQLNSAQQRQGNVARDALALLQQTLDQQQHHAAAMAGLRQSATHILESQNGSG